MGSTLTILRGMPIGIGISPVHGRLAVYVAVGLTNARITVMSVSSCGICRDNTLTRALYTPRETQHILSISHAQFYRLVARGALDARKIGRSTYVTAVSIERFLADLPAARVHSI